MLGIWKSFDELEENLNMDELRLIIKHKREQENNQRKFAASLNGVKFDDEDDPVKKKIREVERRAAVAMRGEQAVQQEEFAELGFGYETA